MSRISVTLECDTKNPLFGRKTGTTINARVIMYLERPNAFVIQDVADDNMIIVPYSLLGHLAARVKPLLNVNTPSRFQYAIGIRRRFYFDDWIVDDHGKSMRGKSVDCVIVGRFHIGYDNWYVVHIPSYDDMSDEYNWWVAYDVRHERRI